METLSRERCNRATLARQLLLARETVPAVAAVERIGGMQAQEPRPPYIGLWTRLDGFAADELTAAIHGRELIRATAMRGTLHLLSAADYAAVRPSLQGMLEAGAAQILRARADGLDPAEVLPAARELLAAQPHTFNVLRALLQERFPDVNDRALSYVTRMHLPLAMVPTDDRWAFPRDSAFALADEWLGGPLTGAGEPDALVLRYLAAFGPASAADAQTWSGVGCAAALERLRPRLAVFADERGRELFDLPDAPRPDADVPAPPRLLPEFDSLLLAHADRTRVIADEHRPAVVTKNLRVKATFMWDGFVAGTWTIEQKRGVATVALAPFAALRAPARRALAAEAQALAAFLEPDAKAADVRFD